MNMQKSLEDLQQEVFSIVSQSLSSIPLFNAMTEEQKKTVAAYMNYCDMAEGDVVFMEGEPGDYVCFVASGSLEVSKNSDKGRKVIAILQAGLSIGEMAVVDEKPRSANVIALTPARLITMSKNNFEKLLVNDQKTGIMLLKAIIRVLSMNLRDASGSLTENMMPVM